MQGVSITDEDQREDRALIECGPANTVVTAGGRALAGTLRARGRDDGGTTVEASLQ